MSCFLSELTIRIFYLGILRGHKLEIFQVFHHKIFIWTLMTWTLIWEFHNELFSTRIFIWRIIIQTITKLLIISTICFFINLTSIVKFCRILTSTTRWYSSHRPPENLAISATRLVSPRILFNPSILWRAEKSNLWKSNIVDISGALIKFNLSILILNSQHEEGARDVNNIWVSQITYHKTKTLGLNLGWESFYRYHHMTPS